MPKIVINLDDNLYSSIVNHRAKTKYQEHIDYEDLKNAVEDGVVVNEDDADYIIREDAFMALTGDITDCSIEEFIKRLRERLSKLSSVTPKHNKSVDYEKCPYYNPDIMFDGEDEYDVGYCQYKPYQKVECEAEDCISRSQVLGLKIHAPIAPVLYSDNSVHYEDIIMVKDVENLPSVYPKKEDYIKANEQLKKQIEMLKLDRDCTMSVLEDIKAKLIEIKEHYDYVSTSDVIKLIDKHCGKEQK